MSFCSFWPDLRALALMRTGVALILLLDLFGRIQSPQFYTDEGVLPRFVLIKQALSPAHWSAYLLNGSEFFVYLAFLLNVCFALMLLFGYHTRTATLLCWVMLVSMHTRNGLVLQGGDVLLRVMLFWMMFLPLGSVWSMDRQANRPQMALCRVAIFCLMLQLALMYWFSAILKLHPIWLEGKALGYALMIDQFVTPAGQWLYTQKDLLSPLTKLTLLAEFLLPLLVFIPHPLIRILAVVSFVAMHLCFGLCLSIGTFALIPPIFWLAFLPGSFFDRFGFKLNPVASKGENSVWVKGMLIFLMLYVLAWNIRTLNFDQYARHFPKSWSWIGEMLRLDQMWNMFAPYPLTDDGWFVVEGTLFSSQKVNLWKKDAPLTFQKEKLGSIFFPDQYWRKYMMNLWSQEWQNYRVDYARYLCRQWNQNKTGLKALETLKIYYVKENTLDVGVVAPVEKLILWDHHCF